MNILDWFRRPKPQPEPWIPRVLPCPRNPSPREYLRKIDLAATYWKRHNRLSYECVLSRAEARLAHWAYEAYRAGDSEHLLAARIAAFKPGWPYFPVAFWQHGARSLLSRFRGPR